MDKKIKISCEGATELSHTKLMEFQGEAKTLATEEYSKLRNLIETDGFCFPIHVWKAKDTNYIIDGHQRLRVVRSMIEDGWECPSLPVTFVKAKSLKDAKRLVLAGMSQYGKPDRQGMYQFLIDSEIDHKELLQYFDLPSFDFNSFSQEFFDPIPSMNDGNGELSGELGEGLADTVKMITCPQCNHEFAK